MKIVLTQDGSRTLFCENAGENFHSGSGALSEARCVFLENSGVQQRLIDGLPTRVLEIGMGTGLNYLVTADLASRQQTPLWYTGIDIRWITEEQLSELAYQSLVSDKAFYDRYCHLLSRGNEIGLAHNETRLNEFVSLHRVQGQAELLVGNPSEFSDQGFDAIYHDAFSPAAAGELWESGFLKDLFCKMKPAGTFSTYCVKSEIQRRLRSVGFQVRCLPGPEGGKRQVLVATR